MPHRNAKRAFLNAYVGNIRARLQKRTAASGLKSVES